MSKRILVVEDDLDISEIVKSILTFCGFKVSLASNGAEGLELASKDQFDLIITDIMMPVMDGNQLIKEISKAANPPSVVVLTAVESEVQFNPTIKAVCSKPISPAAFVETVGRVIGN